MQDKIFVKEKEKPKSNMSSLLIVGIVVILAVTLIGLYILLAASSDDSSSESTSDTATEENAEEETDEDLEAEEEEPAEEPTEEASEEEAAAAEDSATTNSTDSSNFSAPTDETKINLYFPNASGEFGPSLRDKPTENLTTDTIIAVLNGPNAEEQANGYTKTWSFNGANECGTSSTFQYEVVGSLLKVTMCKGFTGTDIDKYITALKLTIIEQGNVSKVAVIDHSGACMGSDSNCLQ
jgi:cytoskeletal protein RodZ